jgi:hypothetical protein
MTLGYTQTKGSLIRSRFSISANINKESVLDILFRITVAFKPQ